LQVPKLFPETLNFLRSSKEVDAVYLLERQQSFVGIGPDILCSAVCWRWAFTLSRVDNCLSPTDINDDAAINLTDRLVAIALNILLDVR
jgi:hypothetical protein